jgi:hypothetical protein
MGRKQTRFHIGNAMIVKDISEWMKRKEIRSKKATYSVRVEGNVYILEGKEIPEPEFDKLYPVEPFPPTNRHLNYDSTKAYIY